MVKRGKDPQAPLSDYIQELYQTGCENLHQTLPSITSFDIENIEIEMAMNSLGLKATGINGLSS